MTAHPTTAIAAPGDTFNFARHLLDYNAGHPSRTAFIDDQGSLNYGELDDRVRRMGAALRALGLRRESITVLGVLTHEVLDGVLYGWQPLELMWGYRAGALQPLDVVGVAVVQGLAQGVAQAGHVGLACPEPAGQGLVGVQRVVFQGLGHAQPVHPAHVLAPAQDLAHEAFHGGNVRMAVTVGLDGGRHAAHLDLEVRLGQTAVLAGRLHGGRRFEYRTKDTAATAGIDIGEIIERNSGADLEVDPGAQTVTSISVRAILVLIVLFLFLRDWRATMISALAIPLSAIPTFWFMDMLGFSLNGISMLALSLVAGVLVDDAIVEIENIVRHMRMGKTAYQASIDAADEIGLAVVATTFSIVAVFLPVGFMPGVSGQFFKNFGLTVVISVLMSLAVARMITPMIAAYFLKAHGHAEHAGLGRPGHHGGFRQRACDPGAARHLRAVATRRRRGGVDQG